MIPTGRRLFLELAKINPSPKERHIYMTNYLRVLNQDCIRHGIEPYKKRG